MFVHFIDSPKFQFLSKLKILHKKDCFKRRSELCAFHGKLSGRKSFQRIVKLSQEFWGDSEALGCGQSQSFKIHHKHIHDNATLPRSVKLLLKKETKSEILGEEGLRCCPKLSLQIKVIATFHFEIRSGGTTNPIRLNLNVKFLQSGVLSSTDAGLVTL